MWTRLRFATARQARLLTAGSLLTLCILTGCTITNYQSPNGEKFTRLAVGSKTSVGELSVSGDTNGVRSLRLKSYANDATETAAAITEAAVRAALAK